MRFLTLFEFIKRLFFNFSWQVIPNPYPTTHVGPMTSNREKIYTVDGGDDDDINNDNDDEKNGMTATMENYGEDCEDDDVDDNHDVDSNNDDLFYRTMSEYDSDFDRDDYNEEDFEDDDSYYDAVFIGPQLIRLQNLSRRIMDVCCTKKTNQLSNPQEFSDIETFQQVLQAVTPGLPNGMDPIMPTLSRVIPALRDRFSIFLSGSASGIYIRPRGTYLHDLDLMCEIKDHVGMFSDGCFNGQVDTSNELTFVNKTFELDLSGDNRIALCSPECKNDLHPVVQKECKSSFPDDGSVEEDEEDLISKLTGGIVLFMISGIPVKIGCGRYKESVYGKPESSVDFVEAIKCSNWPDTMIEYWFKREPKFGWPDEKTQKESHKRWMSYYCW